MNTPASVFAAGTNTCPTWFNQLGLNMESVRIHPLVADFLLEHRFTLLKLARDGDVLQRSGFIKLFKASHLPEPGQSIEEAINLKELSERLLVFRDTGLGASKENKYLLDIGGNSHKLPFENHLRLYTDKPSAYYYFDPEGNSRMPTQGKHRYDLLYPEEGTEVIYRPESYPKNLWHIAETTKWKEQQAQDQTILTLPPPPGKDSENTVQTIPAIQLEKPTSKPNPNLAQTAAGVLRAKKTAAIDQRLQNRALQQLSEVRELQRKLLNRNAPPTEDFADQLATIRQIPHSSDSEEALMSTRSANLYAQEAREGHIKSVQEAVSFLPKLKSIYEQINDGFQKIKITQEKLDRSKNPEEIKTLEATHSCPVRSGA